VNKPVMLVVDDDPQVLAAVRRDLRSKYKEHYQVLGASSGEEAVATIQDLKARGETLAIVITDQRMPGIQGGEVLTRALELYPVARRVLLTAYSDINAALSAINDAHVHHYLQKPWAARGAPVPRRGRPARLLAGRVPARGKGHQARGPPVVAPIAPDQGLPVEQPDPVSLAGDAAERGRREDANRLEGSGPA